MSQDLKDLLKEISVKEFARPALHPEGTAKTIERGFETAILSQSVRDELSGATQDGNAFDYLEDRNRAYALESTRFSDLVRNTRFSPNKPYPVENFYSPSDLSESLSRVFRMTETPDLRKNVVIVGEKGSGKTVGLNMWIKNNDAALGRKKVLWIRCDCHKIYSLWEKCFTDEEPIGDEGSKRFREKRISLGDFILIQLVYIVVKNWNCKDNHFFSKIKKLVIQADITVDYPQGYDDENDTVVEKLLECLNGFAETVAKREKTEDDPSFNYAIDRVAYRSQMSRQRQKRRWLVVGRALQHILTKNDYWILKIVDGADNVGISIESATPYYRAMIDEIARFSRLRPPPSIIHVLAIRERTRDEARATKISIETSEDFIDRRTIQHRPNSFSDILRRRLLYSANNIFDADGIGAQVLTNVYQNLDEKLHDLYHDNVRDFLLNKASICHLVHYRLLQLGAPLEHARIQLSNLESRNLFLHGRLFIDSRRYWRDADKTPGQVYFNIFYTDPDDNSPESVSNWTGLCTTRVLQAIKYRGACKHSELLRFMTGILEYPAPSVERAVKNLRVFGMLDTNQRTGEDEFEYKISEKGLRFVRECYSNAEFLYYFALDVALPSEFAANGLIQNHSNHLQRRTRFPSSAVSTAVTFLAFLLARNRCENDRLDLCSNRKDLLLRKLYLPIQEKEVLKSLEFSIHRLIDAADDRELDELSSYFDRLRLFLYPSEE